MCLRFVCGVVRVMRSWLVAVLWGWAALVQAHPHMWIDVTVLPVRNAAGEIAALQQRWVFDPFFSGVFLQDMARLPAAERDGYWAQLESDMLATLDAAHFYTHPQTLFAKAEAVQIKAEDEALVLTLTMPLRQAAREVAYRLYEPLYYAEMLHARDQARTWQGCSLALRPSEPSAALRAKAAALDAQAVPDEEMGHWFAEEAVWRCP